MNSGWTSDDYTVTSETVSCLGTSAQPAETRRWPGLPEGSSSRGFAICRRFEFPKPDPIQDVRMFQPSVLRRGMPGRGRD